MGVFDDTARMACKLDGAGYFAWLLRRFPAPPALVFDRWDDTRRVSPPGWPERTDDVVAVLRPAQGEGPPTWMIVESETEPERFIFHRLGVYGLLLSAELSRGVAHGNEPGVGTVLLNLTGQTHAAELAVGVAGTPCGQSVRPLVVPFQEISAAATLDEIAGGHTALCLLPWLPLMSGGGQPELIERWKTVADTQPDISLRALYRDLALVFADLSKEQVNWLQGLEGWHMKESTIIQGWINRGHEQGAVEARRALLLKLIRAKLRDPVPEAVRLAIEGTNDSNVLDRWYDAALTAGNLQEFYAVMIEG
jgi:hypothetical protein